MGYAGHKWTHTHDSIGMIFLEYPDLSRQTRMGGGFRDLRWGDRELGVYGYIVSLL